MALPGKLDFTIKQGAEFELIFEIFDVFVEIGDPDNEVTDLTGKSAKLQARLKKQTTTTVIDAVTPYTLLSIPNPTDGKIIFHMDADQTADLDFECANYELVIYTDEEDVECLVEGKIYLNFSVVR